MIGCVLLCVQVWDEGQGPTMYMYTNTERDRDREEERERTIVGQQHIEMRTKLGPISQVLSLIRIRPLKDLLAAPDDQYYGSRLDQRIKGSGHQQSWIRDSVSLPSQKVSSE